jgi:hypothetical protein
MTEWKTLRVRRDAYDRAKEQKEEQGRTWSEQIVRGAEPERVSLDEIDARLARIEEAAHEAELRTGEIDRKLEDLRR